MASLLILIGWYVVIVTFVKFNILFSLYNQSFIYYRTNMMMNGMLDCR